MKLQPAGEKHHGKDEKIYQRAAQILRRDQQQAEYGDKMDDKLGDGNDGIQILILFKITDMLCHHDNIGDFDHLGGLYADAEKPQPSAVSGLALLPEKDQGRKQNDVEYGKEHPLIRKDVHIDHRHYHIKENADHQGHGLHHDIFGGFI